MDFPPFANSPRSLANNFRIDNSLQSRAPESFNRLALGTIVVTGPKAWDFYDRFCNHKATLLKADGKDILAVTMALNSGGESNVDS